MGDDETRSMPPLLTLSRCARAYPRTRQRPVRMVMYPFMHDPTGNVSMKPRSSPNPSTLSCPTRGGVGHSMAAGSRLYDAGFGLGLGGSDKSLPTVAQGRV